MPRIHLILAFLLGSFGVKSQTPISKYITEGNTLFNKGDYYYALDFYDKAYQIDSNSVELIWQMAETYRAYKDYRKAEEFYDKCYRKEEALLYPTSILQLGLMQKMNGKYVLALETFKMAKKKYANDKKSYNYIKSKKEIESCICTQGHRARIF